NRCARKYAEWTPLDGASSPLSYVISRACPGLLNLRPFRRGLPGLLATAGPGRVSGVEQKVPPAAGQIHCNSACRDARRPLIGKRWATEIEIRRRARARSDPERR